MKGFLEKHSKLIYTIYAILMGVVLIAALFFMTQYRYIRVNYESSWKGITMSSNSQLNGAQQTALWRFFNNKSYTEYFGLASGDFASIGTDIGYGYTVFYFRQALDNFNTLLVWFAVFGFVCVAGLFIAANHSRRIYYKSNLIAGIIFPVAVIVFAIILVVNEFSLMSQLNENYNLFNLVSILQNPVNEQLSRPNRDVAVIAGMFNCNNLTFILFLILLAIVVIYSIFLIVYAIKRYNGCAKERQSILEKAGALND